MKQKSGIEASKGMTVIEILVVVFLIVMLLAILLPALGRARGPGCRRPSCQNNLKQWALVFKMYGNESKGELWPPMQTYNFKTGAVDFAVGPSVNALYPEYLTDPAIAICPTDPEDEIDDLKDEQGNYFLNLHPGKIDSSYVYLGWAFDKMGPQEHLGHAKGTAPISTFPSLGALLLALKAEAPKGAILIPYQIGVALDVLAAANTKNIARIANASPNAGLIAQELFNSDITGVYSAGPKEIPYGNSQGDTIFRLREGVERFFITDINDPGASSRAQSKLWTMMDKFTATSDSETPSSNHIPGGANVLYLDGHVEFVRFDQESGNIEQAVSPSMANLLGILSNI